MKPEQSHARTKQGMLPYEITCTASKKQLYIIILVCRTIILRVCVVGHPIYFGRPSIYTFFFYTCETHGPAGVSHTCSAVYHNKGVPNTEVVFLFFFILAVREGQQRRRNEMALMAERTDGRTGGGMHAKKKKQESTPSEVVAS